MDLNLPQEMVEGIEAFKQFYEADNKHRKLTWQYSQGTALVKGAFKARPIEMQLSTLQVRRGGGRGGGCEGWGIARCSSARCR
jgi:hypothetical protein